MSTHALDGTNTQVDLGDGYALTAPAVRGTVESTSVQPGSRARGFSGEIFDAQLEAAGLSKAREIEVNATSVDRTRDFGGAPPTMKLSVPNDAGGSAVVLLQDEAGALRWIMPAETSAEGARGFESTAPVVLTFDVPTASAAEPGARGFGSIGKKLLKVFKFPLEKIEEGVGKIAAGFIRRWEAKNRPNFICTYGPGEYRKPNHADFTVTANDWTRLAQGRALLFVHGTFSSCDAFGDLPPKLMDELSTRYGGRIFAFNHQTLAEDPADNAQFFLNQIPAGTNLTVDIVCHSRGGLVSREIAARGPARGLTVGRLIMVGVPNGGTSLADKEHMMSMVDRLTTVANLFPSRAVNVTIDALVAVVKCAAHALLEELTGLKSMNPKEAYIKGLNTGPAPATSLYAIISNFEPKPGESLFSLTRAADVGVDRIVFSGAQNDLVVPTLGGFQVDAAGFPIATDRLFQFAPDAGVIHTDYFSQADTQARLGEWLEPATSRAFAATARGADLAPSDFDALRPHVINLADGQFSRRGQLSSTRQDVETLFGKTLPAWLKGRPTGSPRRVVFYAHGGLINEKDGLGIANKHIQWWKDNGVFPIYFVWETGLFDALGSLLATADRTSRGIGARGFSDLTDLVVEKACRAARGDLIWGAMKTNAERASMPAGGARVVAQELAKFCTAHQADNIELHAVGHSAGSIFHAHFLTAAQREKVPNFRSLQLLAPAIRVDLFKQRIMPLLDTYVDKLTMFSMTDDYERRDTCLGVYQKSLLYLIHKALERRDGEPVLGLRVSTENDPDLRALFFGTDAAPARAEAVWSVTSGATGANVSTSTTHGGFDDDGPTMSSVGLRIFSPNGKPDAATMAAFRAYSGDARRGREWPLAEEVRIGIESSARPSVITVAAAPAGRDSSATPIAAIAGARGTTGGKRYALCVGIDAYPAPDTLAGCVNDTREWGRLFTETLRFDDVQFLTNTDATRQNIINGLKSLISRAQLGDTLAFQFSGHGTELPDDDGDEADGTDEAFVPVDWQASKFLIDDDLRELLIALPDGVSMTCFIDCCHSGTITRAFGRGAPAAVPGMKARFMTMKDKDPKIVERYLSERQAQRSSGAARGFSDRSGLRWVNFSACDATERAFEQNGNGDFTRIATGLVRSGGIAAVTNVDFQRRLIESFGADRRQTPQLDCPSDAEAIVLFQFVAGGGATARADNQAADAVGAMDRRSVERRDDSAAPVLAADRRSGGERRAAAQQLREIAAFIEADAT